MGTKTQLKVRDCQVFTEGCILMMPVRYDAYDYVVYELEVGKNYYLSCLSGVDKVLATENGVIILESKPRGYMEVYCQNKEQ
jgi:hypothetical protein